MKLERHHQPLLPAREFGRRLLTYAALATGLLTMALTIGTVGYHLFAGLPWMDSLLNASMILSGMGPVDEMRTASAKLFASAYAIFSGVAFLTGVGVFMAPVVHRFLHHFHLEIDEKPSQGGSR